MSATNTLSLTAATRLYIEGHPEGLAIGDAVEALGQYVTDEQAEATTQRLLKAGRGNTDGRKRAIQEALQKLCASGFAKAAGTGDARTFRLAGRGPKGELRTVPLESLTFDRRLQQRVLETDKATANEYAVAMAEGAVFPPLEAIEEGSTLWVYSGFNRGAAHMINVTDAVPVVVTPGTFLDAKLLSLGENATHGLPRSRSDITRALSSVLDDAPLLKRVLDNAADEGGVHRALCAACGISKGALYNNLQSRGLCAKGGKIVKKPAPKIEAERTPAALFDSEPEPAATAPPKAQPLYEDPDDAGDAADNAEEPEAENPAPDPKVKAPPTPGKLGLEAKPKFAAAIVNLREALKCIEAIGIGPGSQYLRKIEFPGDGGPMIAERKIRRGQTTEEITTVDFLVSLIRALKATRPEKVCGGCGGVGEGCRVCRTTGFLPQDIDLVPASGKSRPMFTFSEIEDAWE